ncbi:MOB kinase activator-like 2 isoform X2 [Artemia franciscana]|uniref:MOB kinase activator-like 2 isoform X2 n=1 Tax=Artemia franciscana TaxID=6661 RepID=UPI0032DBD8B7
MFGGKHSKYQKVPLLDIDDLDETVTCFCRKARRKEKDPSCSDEPKLYLSEPTLDLHLSESDLRQIVELPEGLDLNEWLASHTLSFFEHVNAICGAISEYCTSSLCPDMLGPGYTSFFWIDDKGKKSRLSAPQYIDYAMTYVQKTVNDESMFPTKFGHEFPSNFDLILRRILRLLFHCIAHLYHSHYREILALGLNVHLHCVFSHVILLNQRYYLIDKKETDLLHDLSVALRLEPSSDEDLLNEDGSSACSKQSDVGCDDITKHRRSDSGTSRGSCGMGDSGGGISGGEGPNLVAATGI